MPNLLFSAAVLKAKTSKGSIKDYGEPTNFLKEVDFLFGDNAWKGNTRSEGGFKENQASRLPHIRQLLWGERGAARIEG